MFIWARTGMKQSKKIAVTGGIGSGKSTVLKIIAQKGYPVFSCDEIYAELIKDKKFLAKLCDKFGDILNEDGGLDRKKLSSIVFGDREKLARLDALTHPAIYSEMFRRVDETWGLCFCEVPLLFESGGEELFDGVIVVLRDEKHRIESVAKRDNCAESDVQSRINNQFDYNKLNFTKYYVLHNNGNLEQLSAKIDDILQRIEK